jgi:hypothetical protein
MCGPKGNWVQSWAGKGGWPEEELPAPSSPRSPSGAGVAAPSVAGDHQGAVARRGGRWSCEPPSGAQPTPTLFGFLSVFSPFFPPLDDCSLHRE